MLRIKSWLTLNVASAILTVFAGTQFVSAQTITYVGVIRDRTDFQQLNIGKAGY